MKQAKFGVLGAGVLGIIGAFLPFVSFGDASISLWDVRSFDSGQVYITMGGFLIAAIVGGVALAKGALPKQLAGTAVAGFALSAFKLRDAFKGAIGAKLMLLAAIVGLVFAILAIVKPESEG